MKKLLLISLLIPGAFVITVAQSRVAEATLPSIAQSGFYKIPLPVEAASLANTHFTNIRLLSAEGKEVPYLFETETPIVQTRTFVNFPIVRYESTDSISTIIINSPVKETIGDLIVLIKNAEAYREATLSGSDNGDKWFVLKDHFMFNNINSQRTTAEINILDFPLSNYTFYKITIFNGKRAPLNVLNVGRYKTNIKSAAYLALPTPQLVQTDSVSEKKTFLSILFDSTQTVDKLEWTVSGIPFFLRHSELYCEKERINKKGKIESYLDFITDFQLNSNSPSSIDLTGTKAKKLVWVINNEDNPPLQFSSVHAYQLHRYLVAWLESNNHYTFTIENPNVAEPVYDLTHFKNAIPSNLPELQIPEIKRVMRSDAKQQTALFSNPLAIWIALALVMILLSFMSVRLIRQMRMANNQQ